MSGPIFPARRWNRAYIYRLLYLKPLASFITFVSLEAVRPVPITGDDIEAYIDNR